MKAMPNSKPTDPEPNTEVLCKLCKDAFVLAKILYSTMVHSAITDTSIMHTLSMDVTHKTLMDRNFLSTYHGHRSRWQHIIRLYNHSRSEYILHGSVTVIYKNRPHTTPCSYSHVLIESARVREASQLNDYIYWTMLENCIKEARLFGGIGVTTLDKQSQKYMSIHTINIHLGKEEAMRPYDKFERLQA